MGRRSNSSEYVSRITEGNRSFEINRSDEKKDQSKENTMIKVIMLATARDEEKRMEISKLQRELMLSSSAILTLRAEVDVLEKLITSKDTELETLKSQVSALENDMEIVQKKDREKYNLLLISNEEGNELNDKKTESNIKKLSQWNSVSTLTIQQEESETGKKRSSKRLKESGVVDYFHSLRKRTKQQK